MTIHIATLGNEVAPVALGFLIARKRDETINHVHLISENPGGENEFINMRRRNLVDWLNSLGVTVTWEQGPEELRHTNRTVLEAFKAIGEHENLIVNVTGGNKVLSLLTWQAARTRTAQVFTIDAHGAGRLRIHDHESLPKTHDLPALKLEDVQNLYLSDIIMSDLGARLICNSLVFMTFVCSGLPPNGIVTRCSCVKIGCTLPISRTWTQRSNTPSSS
jgi:hypothetical protein